MKAFEISDPKVMRYLHEKNQVYIKWLELLLDVAEHDLGADNIHRAKRQIEHLELQNQEIMDELAK